jgi:localization factor PodJL
LGSLYQKGIGTKADAVQAMHWYEAAALQGNRKAMHDLAIAYAEGLGGVTSSSEAVRWFSRAANLGYVDSQFNLAVLYERGDGVPQSLVDAYKWYAIAGAQGDAESKLRIEALRTQLSAEDFAAAQRAANAFRPQPFAPAANLAPKI